MIQTTFCRVTGVSLGLALIGMLVGCTSPTPPVINASLEVKSPGPYISKIFDKIQASWEAYLQTVPYPGVGKKVVVTFTLASNGGVTEIKSVEGDADEKGKAICVTAVTAGAPYEKWPDEMRAKLGADKQDITITFYYR